MVGRAASIIRSAARVNASDGYECRYNQTTASVMQLFDKREIWWVQPQKLLLFFLIPAYVLVYLLPQLLGGENTFIRASIYFNDFYFALGLLYLFLIFLGTLIGGGYNAAQGPDRTRYFYVRTGFLDVLAWITIIAYVIWFHRILFSAPQLIFDVLTGKSNAFYVSRAMNVRIPGVTSATHFGAGYFIFYTYRLLARKYISTPVRLHYYALAIALLTLLQVVGNAERLALLEIMMPIIVILIGGGYVFKRGVTRFLAYFAPYLGVLLLLGFFAITEYLRSWSSFYQHERIDFKSFVVDRLVAYYYTALNNGAGLLEEFRWPTFNMEYVLDWVHKFPVLGKYFSNWLGRSGTEKFLEKYTDPEFTNMSGIFTILYDLGYVAWGLYALLLGIGLGYLFRTFRSGNGVGIALYPAVFIGILEVMRIPYFGETRGFSSLLPILIGYYFFSRSRSCAETSYVGNSPSNDDKILEESRVIRKKKAAVLRRT